MSQLGKRKRTTQKKAHPIGSPINGREINVVLLNDGRIKRVEVHDENVSIPKTFGRLKDESSSELLLGDGDLGYLLACRLCFSLGRLVLGGDLSLLLPRRDLVGADVIVFVETMEKNVLVAFGTVTAERLVPVKETRGISECRGSSYARWTYQEFPARFVSCLVKGRA